MVSMAISSGGVGRRTSRGRHSAPRAPQESGATIPGTQRRPGQTHTRARGTIEARPPTRHTPPATNKLPKGRSIFIIPGAAKRHKEERKKPVHEGPAQMTGLHRKPLRPFGYRLLNEAASRWADCLPPMEIGRRDRLPVDPRGMVSGGSGIASLS